MVAIPGACRITLALWEIVVTTAQPYNVYKLTEENEVEKNQRLGRWEKARALLGPDALNGHYQSKQDPHPTELLAGIPLQLKTNTFWKMYHQEPLSEPPFVPDHYGAGYPIPQNLQPRLRRAILVLGHCDYSSFVMKKFLAKLLALMDSDARTILDLTDEQFGLELNDRISFCHEYMHKYVVKPEDRSPARYTTNIANREEEIQEMVDYNEENGNGFWNAARQAVQDLVEDRQEDLEDKLKKRMEKLILPTTLR
ncbi:hypothetical protein K458DRAFT_388752 [Lentithecium fluviatile CBS 122367]|uniref:Uncharacterized protein n=1 Tax=Lentithecium fluviatile CBS 122367 TaxID=1168545 RepID=A0A6G1J227_9PLEO|nr:hypothetical protein K458DRAFT_388752 [Lentithecium fluviatile CBS 122367]